MRSLNNNLRSFWEAGTTKEGDKVKFRVLYGGRMSGKSWDVAGQAVRLAMNLKIKLRIMCVRMFQNKIEDSVYSLLKDIIDIWELNDLFIIQRDSITHKVSGSTFKFYGVARNIQEIKSAEGIDILWFEEAQNLTHEAFNTIVPTVLRNESSQIWFTFNPQLESDFSYQRLVVNPPKGALVRQINYQENDFLSPDALTIINNAKEEDLEFYNHIYLGMPKSDDEDSIIKRTWIEASIDAHKYLDVNFNGGQIIGYDVADSGGDRNAVSVFNGSICTKLDSWLAKEDELTESALRAYSHCDRNGNYSFIYDSCGVGAHVGSTLKQINATRFNKFNAGGSVKYPDRNYQLNVKNKDFFENLKAQAWMNTADRFRNTYNAIHKGKQFLPSDLISISSDIEDLETLKYELALPRKRISKKGLFIVETKEEIKKRLKTDKSPDLADSFIIASNPDLCDKQFDLTDFLDNY